MEGCENMLLNTQNINLINKLKVKTRKSSSQGRMEKMQILHKRENKKETVACSGEASQELEERR